MEFEPTRAEHIELAMQGLNHSATSLTISKLRKDFPAFNSLVHKLTL